MINKSKYYFNKYGAMTKSSFVTVTSKVGGKNVKQTYYFDKNGKSLTGKGTIKGKEYTFNKSGVLIKN